MMRLKLLSNDESFHDPAVGKSSNDCSPNALLDIAFANHSKMKSLLVLKAATILGTGGRRILDLSLSHLSWLTDYTGE